MGFLEFLGVAFIADALFGSKPKYIGPASCEKASPGYKQGKLFDVMPYEKVKVEHSSCCSGTWM